MNKQLCPTNGLPGVVVWNREHAQIVFYRVVAWQMVVDDHGNDEVHPLVIDQEIGLTNGEKLDGYLATVEDLLEAARNPGWPDIAQATLEDVEDPVAELRKELGDVCHHVRVYLRARYEGGGPADTAVNAAKQSANIRLMINDVPEAAGERVCLFELLEALKGIDH